MTGGEREDINHHEANQQTGSGGNKQENRKSEKRTFWKGSKLFFDTDRKSVV